MNSESDFVRNRMPSEVKTSSPNPTSDPENFRLPRLQHSISNGISVFTAIKNRNEIFETVLQSWIACEEINEIIIVDWDSEDSLQPLVEKYQDGRIFLATVKDQPRWILSFACNLAASLTSRNQILKMDADVKISPAFFTHHKLQPGIFYTGNWVIARNDNERHLHGTCFMWRDDFFRVNGYNEFIKSYGWDDIDLYDRLEALPLKRYDFNLDDLYHFPHENRTANQNHLDNLKNVRDDEKALVNALINKFLSSEYKPWTDKEQPLKFIIKPVGSYYFDCTAMTDDNIVSPEILQKCEVDAICQRLKERNMPLPDDLRTSLAREEIIMIFNLLSQPITSGNASILYELLNRLTISGKEEASEKNRITLKEVDCLKEKLNTQQAKLDEIRNTYSWKLGHAVMSSVNVAVTPGKNMAAEIIKRITTPKKINLADQLGNHYGQHRSGWSYAISGLTKLHNPEGVLVDSFIERTFGWHPDGIKPHKSPWIGFIHVPPNPPPWFHPSISNEHIFSLPQWQESLEHCRGIYTLTNYHKKHLENRLPVRVNSLLHPTETPDIRWDWQLFMSNREKKIIQVGYWLRKLYSIHLLNAGPFRKMYIIKDDTSMDYLLRAEKENYSLKDLLTQEALNSVKSIPFQTNEEYDRLLASNILYLDLYDSSANNAIIECIVRNTPVLVNPIEPVIEYLGKDYPFYFSNHDEAAQKLRDFDLIRLTHEYLKDLPLKNKLSLDYFRKSFTKSAIYQNLQVV